MSLRIAIVLGFLHMGVAACADADVQLDKINLPAGFSIEVLIDDVPNAREMAFGADGTLFVGTRSEGSVYAVQYRNRDEPVVTTLATDLSLPSGVAFRDGALFVAEVHRILRYDDIEQNLQNVPEPVVVTELPADRHHGWRYIAFGPDDKLYVPIGAPCNICNEEGYGVITRMNPDGSGREVYAEGVRNSVGFTWHPDTGALVFTDNGRDHLGNDSPPCELNMATEAGQHFGYPFCHGGSISDPDFGDLGSCEQSVAPLRNLGPHVAPLGVKFYTGKQFPRAYRGDVFIAEHGSWNRDEPIGYRVTRVRLEGNRQQSAAPSYEVFADGWLQNSKAWGRPADILLDDDGSMLVSDDMAGVIYRISYDAARGAVSPTTE